MSYFFFFFFSSRRRHTRFSRDWSSDVCSSDLAPCGGVPVDRSARGRPVEPRDELLVLRGHARLVAVGDGRLQAACERLRGRAEAQVLEPLLGCGPDALLLLLDVRHLERTPADLAGGSDRSRGIRPVLSGRAPHGAPRTHHPPAIVVARGARGCAGFGSRLGVQHDRSRPALSLYSAPWTKRARAAGG